MENPGSSQDDGHPIDIDRLLAEIQAEAEEWRRRDPELRRIERDIERAWADIAPPGATNADQHMLDRIRRLATLSVDGHRDPRLAIGAIKKIIHKATSWSLKHLAAQINVIVRMLVTHLRNVEQRLDRLEAVSQVSSSYSKWFEGPPEPSIQTANMIADIVGSKHCLVMSCGKGTIVEAICKAGGNAYGIDQDSHRIVAGSLQGLDLRSENFVQHLNEIKEKEVEAIVLAGEVETLPTADLLQLVPQIHNILARPGTVIVAVPNLAIRTSIEMELQLGRGMSPETWQYLLTRVGFTARLIPTTDERITELVVGDIL